ncbi:MAG: TrkA family potassium uptake protein [Desulfovibrionaceae bacterium]
MKTIERLNARIRIFKRRWGMLWDIVVGMVLLFVCFIMGVAGYMLIEKWDLLSSVYMTIITLATVGYGETHALSDAGRIFTIFLIFMGVGGFFYIMVAFSQFVVEGRLQILWGKRRMQKAIDKLNGHFIICGYGRIGSIVVEEIQSEGYDVVVLEQDQDLIEKMENEGILCAEGDATSDELLVNVGLLRARALITALSSEAANVYVTLTARQLNPGLTIVARAGHRSHINRLELAGANRVVLPHLIGGVRMAQNVLRPTVTNFLELAQRGTSMDLQMEELVVPSDSELAGKDIIQSNIRPEYNLIIIAIKRPDGHMIFNPGPKEVINAQDTLLLVGRREDSRRFKRKLYPDMEELA